MSRHIRSIVVVLVAAFVAYILQQSNEYPPLFQQALGRNKTALFIINELSGLHNVHMATIQSLRKDHPDIEVHVASWAPVEAKLRRLSDKAHFHALKGQSYVEAILSGTGTVEITDGIMQPALAGVLKLSYFMQAWMSPWSNVEHFALFEEMSTMIDFIDPAVVVLDTFMWPGISAAREKNRLHAFIVPNMLADNFPFAQPWAEGFWKYPAFGSSVAFPVPLTSIPINILNAVLVRFALSWTPALRAKKSFLKKRGLRSRSMDFYNIHRSDTPWITQTLPEASIPVDYIPPNVSCTGPITVQVAPAVEQDFELTQWLAQAPTVLVNLGNTVSYDEQRALALTQALTSLLDERQQLQVLWKYQKAGSYSEEVLREVAERHIRNGRFRIVSWLEVDPYAILETGYVTAFVHHGGAGSYHEGLAAGVPHIVLPLWVDHYNIATLVEHLNIGIWGCRRTSPHWTAECLKSSITSMINENENTKAIRDKSNWVANNSRLLSGREEAARIVARLAHSGYE